MQDDKGKISGLKVADYWSPTDGWNYDAIDSLAKNCTTATEKPKPNGQ